MLKLKITRMVENPYYQEQMEKARDRYSGSGGEYPSKLIEEEILIAEVTQEQFEAIRKAIINVL